MRFFCFAHRRWCHNGWASNILIVVLRQHPPLKILDHLDTTEDGQNKNSHLSFFKYRNVGPGFGTNRKSFLLSHIDGEYSTLSRTLTWINNSLTYVLPFQYATFIIQLSWNRCTAMVMCNLLLCCPCNPEAQ